MKATEDKKTLAAISKLAPSSQRSKLENLAGGSKPASQMAWQGIREGHFAPLSEEIWRLLKEAPYSADDLAAMCKSISKKKNQKDLALSWFQATYRLTHYFGTMWRLLQPVIAHKQALLDVYPSLTGPIRCMLGFTLARTGALSSAQLDPEVLPKAARAYFTVETYPFSDSRTEGRKDGFLGIESVGDAWGRALIETISPFGKLDPIETRELTTLSFFTPYLHLATIEEKIDIALCGARTQESAEICASFTEDAIPALYQRLEQIRARQNSSNFEYPANALFAALLPLLQQKGETLDAQYDVLLHNALGQHMSGPNTQTILSLLRYLPTERMENVLLKGSWSAPRYHHFHLFPTPNLIQTTVDAFCKKGLENIPPDRMWSELAYGPGALQSFGEKLLPIAIPALEGCQSPYRHFVLRALALTHHRSTLPTLFASLSSEAPRWSKGSSYNSNCLTQDVPEVAAQCIVYLSYSLPEDEILTPLQEIFRAETERLWACGAFILMHLRPTEKTRSLARAVLPKVEGALHIKSMLEGLLHENDAPFKEVWLAYEQLKPPTREEIFTSLVKDPTKWENHEEAGLALFILMQRMMWRSVAEKGAPFGIEESWGQFFLKHQAHPGTLRILTDFFYVYTSSETSAAGQYLYKLSEKHPKLLRALADRVRRGERPGALSQLYSSLWDNEFEDLFVRGIEDKDRAIVEACIEKFTSKPPYAPVEKLFPLLQGGTEENKQTIAKILLQVKHPKAASHLKEAISQKGLSTATKKLLQEALASQ